MSDRLKQETYEALVMVGAFTQIIYEQARKNNNLQALREVKQMAEKNLKSIGVRP